MMVGSGALGGTVAGASLVVRRAPGSAHHVAPLIAAHAWKSIDGRRAARFHSTSEPERRDRAEVATDRASVEQRSEDAAALVDQVMRLVINGCLLDVYMGGTRHEDWVELSRTID